MDYGRVALEAGAAALPPGMEIDLGSVAKGYTGDALAARPAAAVQGADLAVLLRDGPLGLQLPHPGLRLVQGVLMAMPGTRWPRF